MQANEAMIEIKKEINNNEQCRLNLALLETGDRGLEPILNFMEETGTISVNEENYYLPTKKGKELYQQLVDQLEAYVIHFDIYAFVDLEKGTFGDPKNDLLEGNRWSDLRIAVAEYKGIDPYRLVFLAFLSVDKFYQNPDWKFDLSLGTLFDEMEQTIEDQIHVEDLGYKYGNEKVSGDEVIRDVIDQGSLLVKERRKHESQLELKNKKEIIPDEQVISEEYYW